MVGAGLLAEPADADHLDVRVLALLDQMALPAAMAGRVFAATVQGLRELERRRRLADLRRPREEVGVRGAPLGEGAAEHGDRPLLPDDLPHGCQASQRRRSS